MPLVTADVPEWEGKVARATHALLYALLAADPFLGWANASARDWDIVVFGQSLPHIVRRGNRGRTDSPATCTFISHGRCLRWSGCTLPAALYHHFVRHDRVLQRMLPGAGELKSFGAA